MNQELIVKTQPPVLDTNYEALKAHLVQELEKYNVVVTADTVKGAKALATELNATKKQLDDRRKLEVAKASEPIKAFDAQMKELVSLCEDGRQKILNQVRNFEAETLAQAERLMLALRDNLYMVLRVETEFQTATVAPKLASLTGTGKLSRAAMDEVESAVDKCLVLQQRTNLRLSQLENECHRAGLHSPLTREHVEGILFAEESKYQDALQGMIIRELDRQAETEKRARAAAELAIREEAETLAAAQSAVEAAQGRAALHGDPDEKALHEAALMDPAKTTAMAEPAAAQQATAQPALGQVGKVRVRATCTFETHVHPSVSEAAIEAELRKVLATAGISSLVSVIVTKQAAQEQAA